MTRRSRRSLFNDFATGAAGEAADPVSDTTGEAAGEEECYYITAIEITKSTKGVDEKRYYPWARLLKADLICR
ncbi:MAG: hypothetical protein LBE74_09390 [Treponema sp.]|nr:hypothetical protein [Treponema sp.]